MTTIVDELDILHRQHQPLPRDTNEFEKYRCYNCGAQKTRFKKIYPETITKQVIKSCTDCHAELSTYMFHNPCFGSKPGLVIGTKTDEEILIELANLGIETKFGKPIVDKIKKTNKNITDILFTHCPTCFKYFDHLEEAITEPYVKPKTKSPPWYRVLFPSKNGCFVCRTK